MMMEAIMKFLHTDESQSNYNELANTITVLHSIYLPHASI